MQFVIQTSALPTRAVPLLHAQTTESALSFLLTPHVLREVDGTDSPSCWLSATMPLLSPACKHVSCATTTKLYPTTVAWLLYRQSLTNLEAVWYVFSNLLPVRFTLYHSCVAVFADSCAYQLCNAVGSATGTCVAPISAGSICSSSTPGKLSRPSSRCVGLLTVARHRCCRHFDLAANGGLLSM